MAEEKEGKIPVKFVKALEIFVVVLIGVATALGALAAYFSTLWSGSSISSYNKAIMSMSESNTMYLQYLNDYTSEDLRNLKDDLLYLQWKNLAAQGDEDADYVFSRLSPEIQADLTTAMESNGDSSGQDVMSEEEKAWEQRMTELDQTFEDSQAIYDEAQAEMKKGEDANGWGDKFTFSTVLFTVVLFLAGLSTTTEKSMFKTIYTGAAFVLFVYALISFLMIPFPG